MTEVVSFPSLLGQSFHPKELYWGCSLGILLVASAENVGASRSLSHCHSGLTAPCIDQAWHQEPHSATDVKFEPQPFQQVPSTPAVCVGSQHKQRFLSEMTGEEECGFFSKLSNHLPAFQGPGNEQHHLPAHWKILRATREQDPLKPTGN